METVRTALQPVTRSLPAPLFKAGVNLLGADCYKTLILDIKPEDSPECVKLATSKVLGIGIITGAATVKIPQILKLLNSQSASGISFLSNLLETAAFVVTLIYNARNEFPFSTYGETALITAQNVVICLLVLKYQGQTAAAAALVAILAASAWTLQNDSVVSMQNLAHAQVGASILGVASKLPQILTIWQQGGTGQLSAFAVSARIHLRGCLLTGSC